MNPTHKFEPQWLRWQPDHETVTEHFNRIAAIRASETLRGLGLHGYEVAYLRSEEWFVFGETSKIVSRIPIPLDVKIPRSSNAWICSCLYMALASWLNSFGHDDDGDLDDMRDVFALLETRLRQLERHRARPDASREQV